MVNNCNFSANLWDDGNNKNGDGCSSTCIVETGFSWTGGSITSKDTCSENCGDGKRFSTFANSWDDANTRDNDGCSSSWTIENGWTWSGGTPTARDIWTEVCGDGKRFNSILTYWDDGNAYNDDGCNNYWGIESGWKCSGGTSSTKDVWTEIWGDGKRFNILTAYWDDGNNVNDDGWSSTWTIESGWKWSGGSTTWLDVWSDFWGDGKIVKSITK